MAQDPFSPIFCIDVSADPNRQTPTIKLDANEMMIMLLQKVVATQERQVKLLEEISHHVGHAHKQRQHDLAQWKDQNPGLSKNCRVAAEMLAKVQSQYLQTITEDVYNNEENLAESDYALADFCDRYGPRLAHLNGVLQVLSQLSSAAPQTAAPQE